MQLKSLDLLYLIRFDHPAGGLVEISCRLQIQPVQSHRPQQLLGEVLVGLPLNQHPHVERQRLGSPAHQIGDGRGHAVGPNVHIHLEVAVPSVVLCEQLLTQDDGGGAHRLLDDPAPLGDVGNELEFRVAELIRLGTISLNEPATAERGSRGGKVPKDPVQQVSMEQNERGGNSPYLLRESPEE